MDNTVNTSITVTFVSETAGAEDHAIAVELDEERNDSKSRFLFGEKAYFRIYTNPADMKIEIETTAGTIADEGTGVFISEKETAIFQNSKTVSVSKPIKQLVSYEWLGKSLGTVNHMTIQLITQKSGIGVLMFDYTADFKRKSLKLNNPGGDIKEYPVVVFIREVV